MEVGSQDVIAAKCCPVHSLAARGKENRVFGERIKNTSEKFKYNYFESPCQDFCM